MDFGLPAVLVISGFTLAVAGALLLLSWSLHRSPTWIAAPGVDPVTIAPYNKTGIDPASWDAMRSFRAVILRIHIGISMRLSLLLPSTLLASS